MFDSGIVWHFGAYFRQKEHFSQIDLSKTKQPGGGNDYLLAVHSDILESSCHTQAHEKLQFVFLTLL